MKWSPPRIEHCRWPEGRMSLQRQLLMLTVCAGAMTGCASIPVMSPANNELSTAANSAPPEFDVIPSTVAQMSTVPQNSTTTQNPVIAAAPEQKPTTSGSLTAPLPVDPESRAAKETPKESPAVASTTPPTSSTPPNQSTPSNQPASSNQSTASTPSTSTPSALAETKPALPAVKTTEPINETARVALNEPAKNSAAAAAPVMQKPVTPEPAKTAPKTPSGVLVSPPKPFAWEGTGKSTGQRAFQVASPGDDGYRTLVVGSVGGNDPLALELIDRLAHRLHEDSVILGGYDCTIIRTLNPDGEATQRFLNQKGEYINAKFPKPGDKTNASPVAEVDFFLKQLQTVQPQRVVHVRTVSGKSGIVAASQSCESVGKEIAEWLNFTLIRLPGQKTAEGSLERYVSASGSSDMLTIGIPDSTPRAELWDLYGDTLMNLLLRDDMATREMARKQTQPSSADRRNQSP